MGKENKNKNDKVDVINKIASSGLDGEIQKELLNSILKSDSRENGVMDKIFGNKRAETYGALLIAICLLIIGLVCTCLFKKDIQAVKEFWNIFIPALTLVVGYMFGKKYL